MCGNIQSRHANLILSTAISQYLLLPHERPPRSRRAAAPPQRIRLGHASRHTRRTLRLPCGFPAPHQLPASVPGRRHHRRLASAQVLVPGTKATTRCCARSCARRAAAPRSPISRATTTRCSAPGLIRSPSRPGDRRHPPAPGRRARHRRRRTPAGNARRRVRRSCATRSSWRCSATGLLGRTGRQPPVQSARRRLGYPYWSLSAR